MAEDKVTNLYNAFVKNGYAMESEAQFRENLKDPKKRKSAYDALVADGYNMEPFADFESNIGFGAPEPAPEEPAQPAWKPTEQEKIRMQYNMFNMLNDFNQRSKERMERVRRMSEPYTEEGRQRRKAKEFEARMAGVDTKVLGITPPMSQPVADGEEQGNAEGAAQSQDMPRVTQSPVPYGVKYVDGKPVAQWLLPDGSLTTSYLEADQAEYVARMNRLRNEFEKRMTQNGLDPATPDDVETQAQLDAQAPAYEVVADLWKEAEDKHKADEEHNADKHWDSYAAMGGGRELRTVTASMNRNDDEVSHMTRFDLQNMMDNAWERAGSKITANCYNRLRQQYPGASEEELQSTASQMARSLSDNAVYQYAVQQNTPKSTLEFFGRTVADMNLINSISKGLSRSQAGTTGDLAAYEHAMGEYGQNHRVAQIAGTVVGMGIDPVTWVSGGMGSFAGKGAMWVGGRLMFGKAAPQVGARLFGNTLKGRIVAGTAAGAGNFATYEGLKEAESQWKHGGHVNTETGEIEGYSAGEILKSSGHGFILGGVTGTLSPLIGNIADKAVKATSSTGGKAGVRFGEVAVSTLAEGTIFSVPQWISGEGDAFDVWTDNMAMMLGFKAQHGIKSAPRVIANLRPIKPTNGRPLTQAERNHNRMDFEERLRKNMDASPSDISFTADEREELRRAGYGELADLFSRDRTQEAQRPNINPAEGAIDLRAERVEAETIHRSPEFDGYSAMEELMQDGRVSQAARAKAYYILTGRMLPMGSVTGHITSTDKDGRVTVSSVTYDGEIVTSRTFRNEAESKQETNNIMRQAELNSIDVGERYKEAVADDMVLDAAISEVSPGADPATIKKIYRAVKAGNKDVTESQKQLAEFLDDAIARNRDVADKYRPEAIREELMNETGIDVDAVLRKMPSKRTEAEQEAVKSYLERLYPEEARQQNTEPTPEQSEAQSQYEQGRLLYGRFEEADPTVQAEVDAIALRMQEAYQAVEDVFGAEAEYYMFHVNENPWALVNDPELTAEQQDAVLYYINAKAALDGVMDASNEAADRKRTEVEQSVGKRTHKDNGMVIPATMKVDDRQVYVVKGDVVMFPDGTAVDVRNSSESVVVMDAQSGEYEFTSPDQIYKVSEAVNPQDELDVALSVIEQEQMNIFGQNAVAPEEPMAEAPEIIPQNGNNVAENIPAVDETPVAQTETVLSRIPTNEKGEPMFEQAENAEIGWDALVEFSEGDAATAKEIADAMVEEKRKAYEKAQKQKSKGKTPTEILTSKKAIATELAQAEQEYNLWQQMANVEQRRQNAIRSQEEAEARQRAAERAEAEKAEREAREEAERIQREALEGIPEWHMDTPDNARKRGARRFGGEMIVRQEPLQGVVGDAVEVKFSDRDMPKGRAVVIEASQLQPSHIQGRRNPMFFIDEAQPKNRADEVSMMSAQEIAKGIRPKEITGNATAYTGAPTVNTRGEVIQGNNRSDALRYLWGNNLPEQQQMYKQYLLDNAEQFGIDRDSVSAMQNPVLVNMLDVEDAEAIRLGQMTSQDTESGGEERIKPRNVALKLGDDMRTFANRLLSTGDEDASFGQLVDRNAAEVLKWMNQIGAISNTQYKSAFDTKGNLTAEAKNDLQKVLYQAVFKGGSKQLEEMFEKLPAKAQRAILSTAFRDMDSPVVGQMLPEIQASVVAYHELMKDECFANAKKIEDVLRAVDVFKRATAFDDRLEQYKPSDNFSNFALHLAAMYKASDMSQLTIASYFNQMYDLAQGKKAATLFEEADATQYPLAEIIKQVLNIDYQPAKNGNNNVANGGADVALRNQNGQGGELRGDESPASRERASSGTEPSERGGRAVLPIAERGGQGNIHGTQRPEPSDLPQEETTGLDENGLPFIVSENGTTSFGVIREESGLPGAPIKLSEGYQDENGKGYGLRHIEAGHGEEIRKAGFSTVEEFVSYVAKNYDEDNIRVGKQRRNGNTTYLIQVTDSHDNTLFIELSRDGSYWNVNSGGIFRKGYSNKKETVTKTEPQRPNNVVSSGSSLSNDEQSDTSSNEPNGEPTVSERKFSDSVSEKQEKKEESSSQLAENRGFSAQQVTDKAAAEENAEPTEAQKAAGNYKMEHRRVDGYNISIENAKGSVRRGTGADGKPWETVMQNDYGYIRGTEGVDGDHIDVFLSDTPEEGDVFVVDQVNEDGSFDEHKVMYGFPTEQAARDAYLSNYEPGWTGLGAITHVSKDEFKKWIQSSRRKTKPFAEYKSVKPIEGNGMIGRSLTEQEATELIARMEATAEVAPTIELTPENWIAQFGEDGTVETPIGIVKMGANQLLKLYSTKRTGYFGMIHPTLSTPDVILEEADPKEGSERDSKYLFVKTFVKSDGSRIVHFESVTVKKDGMEVSISSHEIKDKSLKNKMQNDIVLHLDEKLSPSSEMRLTEAPSESEGPDLVPTSDNVISSDRKVNTLSADKQAERAESSEPYTITATTYTNKKGKTSDVHLVKFNRELTAEEKAALDTFAREPLTEGKKTSRGWYDRKQGGYMMRSEEAARQLAEMIGNEEAVADAQPMTAEELREAVAPVAPAEEKPARKPKKAPINRVSLEDVMTDLSTKGETKLSDHAEPVRAEPEQQHEISDAEMQSLADELRDLLGIGDDEGDTNIKFRDPGELTPQERQRIQSAGIRLAMGLIERGTTAFPDYATKMVGLLGDKIRPWLKSFYEGARWTPGYDKYTFTPTEQVATFDVQNFDKKQADPIAQAAMIVEERKASTASAQAHKELTETRNKNRRENDKQTETDTAALAEKAEAVAGEAEVTAQSAGTGEAGRKRILRDLKRVDDTLDEVNDELAILGYYEAEQIDKDFNEAYGYMRNAEKKAVKDAVNLAKQLVYDLGLEIDKVAGSIIAKRGKKPTAVSANIAPAGGDISIRLPLNEGRELYITIGLDPSVTPGDVTYSGDDLQATRIMYRVEWPDEKDHVSLDRMGRNCWADANVTYADLLKGIRREAKDYLPSSTPAEEPAKSEPQEEAYHGTVTLKDGREAVVIAANYVQNIGEPARLADYIVSVKGEPGTIKISPDEIAHAGAPTAEDKHLPAKAEETHNGYKVGDEVMWDRYGNGKWEKQTIVDFEKDGRPIFDSMGIGMMMEIGDWERIKPADGIFGEAQRVARAEQEKKKSATPAKKKTAVKPEQPVADLFGGLFDEPINDEKKTDVQPRPGTAERERGHEPQPNEPLGESQRNEVKGTDGRGMGGRDSVNPMSDRERGAGVSQKPKSQPVTERVPESERKNVRNNHAERGVDYAPKGEDARIKANIEAIELAKRLLDAGETATPEQMAVLRKFSGWGGLGKAFNESGNLPNPTAKHLRELLGEDGYNDAVMSRNSAYYTPAEVIDTMWDVAKAMGFKGGNVLEGSAGIGNILGLMPTELSERSSIHAVEIDRTTGGILSLLYPDAQVDVQGFEKTKIRNNTIDLSITNVPFVTGLRVMDETGDKDLSKKFHDIHDFCIAKNIRKLREGGIGIFITSSGTMDNSKELRRWIINEGNADVVGAFRMHNKTFGGTGATSDIIVVRKRVNGKPSPNAIDVTDVTGVRVADYDTGDTRKVKGREIPIVNRLSMDYNKYFAEHPEFMAGEMRFGFEEGDTFRPKSKALYPIKGKEQSEMLTAWAERFADMEEEAATPKVEDEVTRINEQLGEGVKEGSMVLNSQGELCMARMGEAVPLGLNKNKVKGHTKAECFNAYTAIKKALSDVLEYQSTHDDNEGLAPLLKELNRAFDAFTRTYGNLHKNTAISFLRNDVDFSSILALETYSEKGDKKGNKVVKVGKTDIFSRRVIETEKEPQPTTIKDGILASLYKNGGVDVEYIGQALGKSTEDVKREIVESGLGFENPSTGAMEVSYQYLSGNVREKLHIAQENNEGGRYDANIKALEGVMPMTIPAHLIEFALGSSWIEPKLYEDFVFEKTGIQVKLTNVGGTWFMKTPWSTFNEKNRAMAVVSKMCDKTIMGHELIEAAITNRQITVSKTEKHYDGSTETITDKAATAECGTKVDEIRAEFKDWAREHMQADPAMSARIEQTYNDQFNNYVPMSIPDEFVPQHFGGQVSELHGRPFALRPHQGRAVVRGTTEPILLAHEVGTGKTYTLITTAMEMRRLGTARKPMIVVQNATVGQFVESAKEIYPNAKVLTIEEADRTAEGRRNFYAKIKYNDWDMIVVPQSVFERIPDSPEREMAYVKDIIEEKMKVLEAMREADSDGRSMIVRQAEKELAEQEERLAELTEAMQGKKKRDEKKEATTRQNAEVRALEMLDREVDDVENFDDMGIDAILVDEAHEYKHLGFSTAMQRGVKGVDPSYSKKSQGVFLKAQAVMERNNGRNVVFATGTPISNTAAEIWTFMRYLMPVDTMKAYGIYYFDDFVRNFGNIAQMVEFSTNGKFKENNRFAGYVNLPELVRIWSSVADIVLTREAGGVSDKIPDMEGGKPQDIYLPQTRALRSVMKYVKSELDRFEEMSGKEKKENSHIPLTMYGIAKAAAVDVRLVIPNAEDDPNSKTNATVRETLRSLKDSAKYKGTVAIFSDNYQNNQSGFNLYEDIRKKLIAEGVPADQIVVIKSGMTVKKKLDIFEKVNAGEIRVIMGSTFTLGTGVNIQERLHTLIHVDAPNRPMDYTQRNGRALRQGNLHKDMGIPVRIIRFGVEDSLDVTAYQRLKTKGAIADSIMNGSKMMQNSMENRVLEEEEDSFGDMTAQLSGSEYAILKNQAEREVRSLTAKQKGHDIDQIYVHNQLPKVEGFIKGAEHRIALETKNLEVIGKHFPDGSIKKITIGKLTFDNVGAMEDFFKEQNAKMNEAAEAIREGADNYTSKLTVDVDGLQFEVTTTVKREVDNKGQGTLSFEPERNVTYSCEALGIKDESVKGNRLKNVMQKIAEDIATGNASRELLNRGQQQLAHYSDEYRLLQERNGREFPYKAQLAEAKERLAKYEEAMKKELEEKEAKYAEMDKDVEEATAVSYTEEDDEETASNGDGNKYRLVEDANNRFNRQLERYINGDMTKNEMLDLGKPLGVMSQFLPELPIVMRQRILKKGSVKKHNVDVAALANMPQHLASPIFVFQRSDNAFGILTEMQDQDGKNVCVAIELNRKIQDGGDILEVNDIRSIHGRNVADIVFPIVQNGTLKWADKEKGLAYLSSASRYVQQEIDKQDLDSATKVVENFENPTLDDENIRYQDAYESSAEAKESRVLDLSDKLNTPVKLISSQEEIDALPNRRQRRAKGWWSDKDNSIVIVVPNNVNVADIENTFVHEVVGHKGLRALIGADRFDEFLGEVYDHASEPIRKEIDKKTNAMVDAEADRLRVRKAQEHEQAGEDVNSHYYTDMAEARVEAEKKREQYRKEATEEYMADMAGKIGDEGFEKMNREEQTLWGKIKAMVQQFLDKFLQGLKIAKSIKLTDKDLAYILFKSWKNMRGDKGVFAQAEDAVMRYRTDWDNETKKYDAREAVANHIVELFDQAVRGDLTGKPVEVGTLTAEGKEFLERLSGITMKDNVSFVLNPSDLVHMYRGHYGNNEKDKGNNIPLTKDDIRAIVDIICRPDKVIFGIEHKAPQRNLFYFLSEAEVGAYNLLEIYGDRKGNLTAKTFYKTKKAVSQRVLSLMKSEHLTSVTDGASLSDGAKLPKFFECNNHDDEEIVRYRDGDDIIAKTPVLARGLYEQRVASSSYQVREALQDSMLGLKEAYLAIEKASGRKQYIEDIAGFENAYLWENRMSSKNQAEQGAYERLVIKPMLDEVARLAPSESKRAELTEYMMAKHGLERNALMRSNAVADGMDQKAADATDFAGLTGLFATTDVADAEDMARTCVSDFESVHNTDELWNKVNAATKATLSKLKECGLLSAATHDNIANMYDNYIPLRGWAETTADEVYGYLSRNDGNLRGSVLKKAEGRKSVADDPIATIALMGEQAIAQANRNKMKQAFFNYVRRHPSDLVSVNRLWLQRNDVTDEWEPVFASNIKDDDDAATVQQKIDAFEQKMESMAAAEPDKYKRGRQARGIPYKLGTGALNEHTVLVKCGDDTYVMTINGNPRAAQALNGLTNPDVGTGVGAALFGLGEKINHAIAPIYTTRNPDFMVSNFLRDALYTNTMTWVKESPRYAARFNANFLRVNPIRMARLVNRYNNNTLDMNDPIERKFHEFIMEGGETGYTNQRDIEKHKKAVKKMLKRANGRISFGKVMDVLAEKWDVLNSAAENCARFAAYLTSLEEGRSVERAIYDAKEISVNFNKKGSGATFMGVTGQTKAGNSAAFTSGTGRGLLVFWNAVVQASTNFMRNAERHPFKMAGGLVVPMFLLGAVQAILGAFDDGDDDDENNDGRHDYFNQPDYVRRSNILLRIGDQYLAHPLPHEYLAVFGFGEMAATLMMGKEEMSAGEISVEIAKMLSEFSPIPVDRAGWDHAVMPSSVKPLYEASINESWTGMPIYKQNPYNEDLPEWTKAYSSANHQLVNLAEATNRYTGGDAYTKGDIDFNPAQVEYVLNGYLGGYFKIADRMIKMYETATGEREFEWRNMPLANRVVKQGDERTAMRSVNNAYFEYQNEYENIRRRIRSYESEADNGIFEYAAKLAELSRTPEFHRYWILDGYQSEIRAINKDLKEATTETELEKAQKERDELRTKIVGKLDGNTTLERADTTGLGEARSYYEQKAMQQ